MLVNMMGVDDGEEITDIGDHRVEPIVDPKSRETLTTLFGALLSSYTVVDDVPAPASAPIAGTIQASQQRSDADVEHGSRWDAA